MSGLPPPSPLHLPLNGTCCPSSLSSPCNACATPLGRNPLSSQFVDEQGAVSHWYLAIGSMINPHSLALRSLVPLESHAAILRDYSLVFRGEGGFASILPHDSTAAFPHAIHHFHGVLHRLNQQQMEVLDKIESCYNKLQLSVQLYDGSVQMCSVYQMCESNITSDGLPSQRYLEIIIQGAQHFGLQAQYIQQLRAQPVIPRKPAELLERIPLPIKLEYFTTAQLALANGRSTEQPNNPLMIAINQKVLRFDGDLPFHQLYYNFMQTNFGGTDLTFSYSRLFYDPLYRLATSRADMDPLYIAQIEDLLLSKKVWKCVGLLLDISHDTVIPNDCELDSDEVVDIVACDDDDDLSALSPSSSSDSLSFSAASISPPSRSPCSHSFITAQTVCTCSS